ncbi:MAG: sensor domain-containing diguanylate cyclase [Thiobacillus sp.]|nr:sensor domain-containing diguanylate cyclase [Thiobacillus sp.]
MKRATLLVVLRRLPLVAGVLMACAVWLLLQSFVWLEQDRRHQAERAVLQAEAATVRARLESELNATLSLSLGLSTFVLAKPDFSQADLEQVAASLIRLQPAIRSVALAPDNVIRFIYPLAGNQKALGLRYLETPSQRDAVLRLLREQRPVTAGPIELAQGGVGIINRIPIIYTRPDGSPHYWGLASVAINPFPIFENAGIRTDALDGVRYALRGKDGLGARGEVFLGNAALFDDRDTVLMDVTIPGGSWQLAAHNRTPAVGYGVWIQALLGVLAAVAGLLVAYSLSAHQRIRSMALHDHLTGLANRYQFKLRGQDMFALARRNQCHLTLLNIDIDDFKSINDTYGHAAGDAVLVYVAGTLRACCRESDLLARVGGDEFVVLLPDTPAGPPLDALLGRLHAAIDMLLPGTDIPIRLRISIGVATCSAATPTLDALMHQADEAMYRAKEKRSSAD